MGIMMPETCWVNLKWINIFTCVIRWFFLLLNLMKFSQTLWKYVTLDIDNLIFPNLDFKIEFCFRTKTSFPCRIICPIRFLTNPTSKLFCLPRRSTDSIFHTAITVFTVKFIWSNKKPIKSHNKTSELSKEAVSCALESLTYDLRPLAFSYHSPSQTSPLLPHFGTPYLLSTL